MEVGSRLVQYRLTEGNKRCTVVLETAWYRSTLYGALKNTAALTKASNVT